MTTVLTGPMTVKKQNKQSLSHDFPFLDLTTGLLSLYGTFVPQYVMFL